MAIASGTRLGAYEITGAIGAGGMRKWTLTRDGKRFLRIQQVAPERAGTQIDLVLNFFSELSSSPLRDKRTRREPCAL